jgi:hypothetical protein
LGQGGFAEDSQADVWFELLLGKGVLENGFVEAGVGLLPACFL